MIAMNEETVLISRLPERFFVSPDNASSVHPLTPPPPTLFRSLRDMCWIGLRGCWLRRLLCMRAAAAAGIKARPIESNIVHFRKFKIFPPNIRVKLQIYNAAFVFMYVIGW
jgi:hypothetical protein